MRKSFYFLSPVEVVKVTAQNLEEVAEWCGGQVQQTESRNRKGQMDSYVWVPTPKGSAVSWAFPGMYVTKRLVVTVKDELKTTWAVFRRDYFEKNYFETVNDAVDKTWELEDRTPKPKDVTVNVHVSDAFNQAVAKVRADVAKIAEATGVKLGEDKHTPMEGRLREDGLMEVVPAKKADTCGDPELVGPVPTQDHVHTTIAVKQPKIISG